MRTELSLWAERAEQRPPGGVFSRTQRFGNVQIEICNVEQTCFSLTCRFRNHVDYNSGVTICDIPERLTTERGPGLSAAILIGLEILLVQFLLGLVEFPQLLGLSFTEILPLHVMRGETLLEEQYGSVKTLHVQ